MSALDIVILLVLGVAILHGIWKGLIQQAGALAAILVGIILCRIFGDAVTDWFIKGEADPGTHYVTSIFANVIIFAVGYIVTRIFAQMVRHLVAAVQLGIVDRVGGALFSLFEWLFILSMLLNLWQAFRPQDNIADRADKLKGRPMELVMNFAPAIIGSPEAQQLFDRLAHHDSPEKA